MAYRPKDTQERILHRMKIAKGHLEKVMEMIENDEYCIDILHQLNAIQEGLKGSGNLIIQNHLQTCVSESIKKGESKRAISEIMEVLEKRNL